MAWKDYRRFPTYDQWWAHTDEERIAIYRARWDKIYRETPWDELSSEDRRAIIKCRFPRPDTCPECGKKCFAYLWNKDDRYADDDSNWYYSCRECRSDVMRSDGPGCASTQFKEKAWALLTRKSKVRRIQKILPMPSACPRCDAHKVELCSWSGRWLEDVTDYIWLCRHHATIHNKLLLDVPVRSLVIQY